ncbi:MULTISPECIES: hypothetical protein [unclassified Streptomyces]|uniref:hypothetical protein n=1 Tax=unclassified Streptomyces TaxID=2593676 RepID=UPI003865B83D|nr:hypothetical protein OG569_22855 [Streptomyces sp. NBC_00827]
MKIRQAVALAAGDALLPRAEKRDPEAMFLYGRFTGDSGEALAWFRRAADLGHQDAMLVAGARLAYAGDLVTVPYLEALALNGDRLAARTLADLFRQLAEHWSTKASEPSPDTVGD